MRDWTRRQLLQTGASAALAGWLPRDASRSAPLAPRERLLLDFGWRFHLGDANDIARDFGFGHGGDQAAEYGKSGELFNQHQKFDDSAWRLVDLPHDWVVELPYINANELNDFGDHPIGRNYPATSIGWYRRSFTLPATDAGRRISLQFDGIFRDAIVALNGHLVGRNFSGYAPYHADITDIVTWGGINTLMIRVDATEHEGWFYEGAGIYRHVWLTKTNPLHVAHDGTFVTSRVGNSLAQLEIATELDNDGDTAAMCRVIQTVADASGRVVARTASLPVRAAPWAQTIVKQQLQLSNPALWSIEAPVLYTVDTAIEVAGAEVDRHRTTFGIRSMRWDANDGFFLNGKRVVLKGTCNHQDHAGVGVALPDRLQEFRIGKLKEMGSNAYRTSHNPPTPELLDACDRLGMLVLDENRTFSSEEEGTSQLQRLIRRDRNHPSVFAWSLANEEWIDQGNNRGLRMATTLRRLARRLDPTRPVTAAMNSGWGGGFSNVVDVQGFNYGDGAKMDQFHAKFPALPSMGTEVASTVSTRGIYTNDKEKGFVSAYDVNFPPWAARAETWWTTYAARKWVAGGFVWTGFDYRGEPTPYKWPCTTSHFGIMDSCGFPKDNFYYYQSWWSDKEVLHLFPHWNWPGKEGEELEVWVHSNLDRVELFVNGASAGAKEMPRNSHLSWTVRYQPGAIEARGWKDGKQVMVTRRETTGVPAMIVLTPDRNRIAADGEDVSVIEVRVVDQGGRTVPVADNEITFRVTGPGKLIGVGNGNPSSHEDDKGSTRLAFNGLCCAIVQSSKEPGEIQVGATAAGLTAASVGIVAEKVRLRPTD